VMTATFPFMSNKLMCFSHALVRRCRFWFFAFS